MDTQATHLVTNLLQAVGRGDDGAGDRLMEAVYDELRRMAAEQMAREAGPRTLQPTALVHEAYLRLVAGGDGVFENRRHFFTAAATAMQRILVDYARRREALKRGGGQQAVSLPDGPAVFDQDPAEVLDLSEALGKLEGLHPKLAEVVRLRYFVGLSVEETAEVLGASPRTIANRWQVARAWLHRELKA